MNRVTLIGNLGQEPDIRTTQAGGKVASMTLAILKLDQHLDFV